jgi:alpha-ketoglutarate-dependent 2,4-dichlorophenoxyacetate dioxygenase
MALEFTPLHPLFAAEVGGIDLRRPLDEATVAALDAAMDRYALLVFRDQPMTESEQVACARQFGPLDAGLRKATGAPTRFGHEELIDISNLSLDGSVAGRDNAKLIGTLANQLWHSDSSFQPLPIAYSMLSAVVVPDQGGDTEWADLRAAWDALPDDLRAAVEGRTAHHSTFHSRIMLGDDKYTPEQLNRFPPAEWPLVRMHPSSGRKLLFVGVHCDRVSGLTVPEARVLIADLIEHATQRQFVYRHKWRAGDYVMWDNRSTLHRGRRYDLAARRDLRRTTTLERQAAQAQAA